MPHDSILRWWRRVYWLKRDFKVLPTLLSSGPMLYAARGGIGDELLTTALTKVICEQSHSPVTVFTRYPALFDNNPSVRKTFPADDRVLAAADVWHRLISRPFGWQPDLDDDRQVPPSDHILAEKARAAELTDEHALRPYLYLRSEELARARADIGSTALTLQTTGVAAQWHMANKEWGVERFQSLLPLLPSHLSVVQVGNTSDPLLSGAIDRRGASFRESAAYLQVSQVFVGLVGFLMHLARAVNRRSVIIYGGREHPQQSGYPGNENLFTTPPCSPCWQKSRCDYHRVCLSRITPEQVAEAVHRALEAYTSPLPTSTFRL